MLVCPVCGFRNPDQNARCFKCQAVLEESPIEFDRVMTKIKRDRDQELTDSTRAFFINLWERNPLRRYWEIPQDIPYRFPFTAGGMSAIVPGSGQFYNCQKGKALIIFFGWALFVALGIFTIRQPFSNFVLLGLLLIWFAIWSDAVTSAVRINGGTWSFRNSIALWFGVMFLVGVFITGAQIIGKGLIAVVKVTNIKTQTIREGDLVFVNQLSYLFSEPEIGDLVYFDPPKFRADRPPNMYFIDITNYLQFVCGQGGDTVQRRGNVFYRNDQPVADSTSPIEGNIIPEWKMTVESGKYYVPVTRIPRDALAAIMGAGTPPQLDDNWNFPGWKEASQITKKEIYGRAVAIINPPHRRQWF